MTRSDPLGDILNFPWPLRDYEQWLSQRPAPDKADYLYTQSRVRLQPHDDDELAIPESLSVADLGNRVGIRVSAQVPPIAIPKLGRQQVEALLAALRKRPTVIELPIASALPADICDQFLKFGFGQFIFAPAAIQQLESQTSAAEIVRFPGSPYEIVRNYWTNIGHINLEITRFVDTSDSSQTFVHWLRSLHAHLLLGVDLRTFYCPASPVARHRVAPGALYDIASRTITTPSGEFILEGPRVNATTVGGKQYHRLLNQSLNRPEPDSSPRVFSNSGTIWGQLVNARSRGETQARTWFLPPRPMSDEHWEQLWNAWSCAVSAVDSNGPSEGVAQLAYFHWYFVHLHPFSCANQSLAFAFVNWVLRHLFGCGIPQLVLDQLALRYECADYARLFKRAVNAWVTTETEPQARHLARVHMRRALDAFVERLDAAKDDSEMKAVSEGDSEGARVALVVP